MKKRTFNHRAGLRAELLALLLLRLKGYRILARRWKNPACEIDILARRGDVVAVIEVKTRRTMTEAAAAISPAARRNLAKAARMALAHWPELGNLTVRFDAVLCSPWRWPRHVANAWQEESW